MASINPLSGLSSSLLSLSPSKSLTMLSGLGSPAPGSNPMNPLQGQLAVTGIGQFISQIMLTSTLRKLTTGLLGGNAAGGAGANPAAALTTLLGQLGGGGGLVG